MKSLQGMKLLTPLLLTALLLSPGIAAQASITIYIPTALQGTSGTLAFQFNPNTDGTTPNDASVMVADPLGSFTLTNQGAGNESDQPITFGSSFTFTPTFTLNSSAGAAVTSGANGAVTFAASPDEGNTFFLQVEDSGGNVQATTDPSGIDSAVTILQAADGTTSPAQVYSPFATPAVAPEPSGWAVLALISIGLLGLLLRGRMRRAAP